MQASIISSVYAPKGYVYDGLLAFSTADIVNIIPGGVARSTLDLADIPLPVGALPVNMTTSGAGGLDVGVRAAQTNYAIYVIMDPAGSVVSGLASLSFTAPTLPSGFTIYRRVGAISLNSASGIRPFFMSGLGLTRRIWWQLTQGAISDTSCRALNAGNATVSTAIAAANRFFFPTSPEIWTLMTFVSAVPGSACILGPTGVTAILNQVAVIAQVAAVAAQDRGIVANVGSGSPRTISYSVPLAADAANVWIQGCTDQLAA